MSIDISTVEHTAHLSKIDLTEEEKQTFAQQLSDVLDYVEKLNALDTEGIEPTDHVIDNVNVLRDDVPGKTITHDDLKLNAPHFEEGHFAVPKIIE